MTKEELTRTASALKPLAPGELAEYRGKRDRLVARINERMAARADIGALVGEENLQMMKDNHGNHARFVESVFLHPEPAVLVDTVLWVFRSYRSRGFHPNYWAAQISAWIELFKEELSPETYAAVYPLYEWFSINIPHFTDLSDSQLQQGPKGHSSV